MTEQETTRQKQAHELCALFLSQYKFFKVQERINYTAYLTKVLFMNPNINQLHDVYQVLAAKKFIRWVRLFDKPVWEHLNRPIPDFEEVNGKILWEGKDAVKTHIKMLAEKGTFVKWIKPQFLWLLHYMDSKTEGYDHKKISLERIAKLPQEIQDCLNYQNY